MACPSFPVDAPATFRAVSLAAPRVNPYAPAARSMAPRASTACALTPRFRARRTQVWSLVSPLCLTPGGRNFNTSPLQ